MSTRVRIPDSDAIQRLPLWARVAFAARCARRVLPEYDAAWPQSSREHARAVAEAVQRAEETAGLAVLAKGNIASAVASRALDAADAARSAGATVASCVAVAAATAAHAAAAAVDAALANGAADSVADRCVACVRSASLAGELGHPAQPATALDAIWADYDRMKAMAAQENWTDETAVSPGVFARLP
jgi:hypothetical protein